MRLHKKDEKIKEELGDRAGLAITWWNQGIIHGDQGDIDKKITLWQKSIAMNKELGIPTAEDEKDLEKILSKKEKIAFTR